MDQMILKPKLNNFDSLAGFAEWLADHGNEVPGAAEIWIFGIKDIDEYYMYIGNGTTKLKDLPRVINM